MVAVTSDDAYPVFGFHLEDPVISNKETKSGSRDTEYSPCADDKNKRVVSVPCYAWK